MNEVLEFYQQQAKQRLSTIPWVAKLQEKSLRELMDKGFPSRHDEDWKYTMVSPFLQSFPAPGEQDSSARVHSDLPIGQGILIQNGRTLGIEDVALPPGVFVLPLFEALEHHADKIKPYFDKVLEHEHGFHALNTALVHTGIVVYVARGVVLENPLLLSHWQDSEKATHLRHLIILEEDSQASVIEDYRGASGCNYFTNTITEVFIGERAQLTHYKMQREGLAACHFGQIAVQQAKNSQFANHSLNLGGKLVRSDIRLQLKEEGATSLMNGIYMPTEGQHIDQHTTVHHLVPNCRSEQDYKGILAGHSRAVFNGKVIVAKDAQQTQAKQQNKNLLLSPHAEIDTKPQLEIFADDVICTHGATVGQLDEEALFYLATRGIDRQEASHYLIHAFTAENLRLIPNQRLADWMGTLLGKQLR